MRRRVLAAGAMATILRAGGGERGRTPPSTGARRRAARARSRPVCNTQPQNGALFVGSEVEPWIDVDPTSAGDADGPNLIGAYQQDRYSTGGARGLGVGVDHGGDSYTLAHRDRNLRFTRVRRQPPYEWLRPVGELCPPAPLTRSPCRSTTRQPRQCGPGQPLHQGAGRHHVERADHAQARHEPDGLQ